MIALDVRVDMRPMLANVGTVRTFETRCLAALVLEMSLQSAVPQVSLATFGTLVGTTQGSFLPEEELTPATGDPLTAAEAGTIVGSCKAQGCLSIDGDLSLGTER